MKIAENYKKYSSNDNTKNIKKDKQYQENREKSFIK